MNTQQKIDEIQQSYDETPYVSNPIRESHPYHLQAMCQLVGLETPDYRKAKVLEIGCSFGGNIISMAIHNPEMEITGIDLSEFQINEGKKIIEAVGLTNIELIQADINQYQVPENYFDYIICHGVFSWVPEEVQQSILKVIQKGLTDNGVAYVSYNTYPGWKINEFYREAMLFATKDIEDGNEKYKQAMETLNFLKENMVDGAFSYDLEKTYKTLKGDEQYYIRHEYLEGVNKPLYFSQFSEMLKLYNLSHIVDSDLTVKYKEGNKVARFLTTTEQHDDIIAYQQYLDFVTQRTFRRSIITKKQNLMGKNISYSYDFNIMGINKLFITGIRKGRTLGLNEDLKEKWLSFFDSKEEKEIILLLLNKLSENLCFNIGSFIEQGNIVNKNLFYKIVISLYLNDDIIFTPYFSKVTSSTPSKPYISKQMRDFAKYLINANQIKWIGHYGSKFHLAISPNELSNLILIFTDGKNTKEDIINNLKKLPSLSTSHYTQNDEEFKSLINSILNDLSVLNILMEA